MKTKRYSPWLLALLAGALAAFFALLFFCDNKYRTPPPYGKDGVISLSQADFASGRALYLIDGWLLTDNRVTELPTYVGEFATLQRKDHSAPPHGRAVYRLTLRYAGAPIELASSFPKLSTDYVVRLDGQILAQGAGSGSALLRLGAGDHVLTVETVSRSGYYSGMYFPPVLGRADTLAHLRNIRTVAYAFAACASLLLALFTLALWRGDRRSDEFCLGILCLFFALYLAYYFADLLFFPALAWWQIVQGFALYGLIFCVVRLAALATGEAGTRWFRHVQRLMLAFPALMLALYLLIPVLPQAVRIHGTAKDVYFILVFCCMVFLTVRVGLRRGHEHRYMLAAGVVFSAGLLVNLFFSNLFEPIFFFWQFEWCGLLQVALFAAMMIAKNKRIMRENTEFTEHLEQLVVRRTEDLQKVLDERRAFFSEMAHDLKAPLHATGTFIRAIRKNNTGVDTELLRYIDQVEQKQREMSRRVQGLNVLSQLDRIEEGPQRLSVRVLMEELYRTHHADAEVSSIHLTVQPPEEDCAIIAQRAKLDILFENLIYNAFKATPLDGHITVGAEKQAVTVLITVSDTGCGIPPDELPHIFQRFYVGARNSKSGSGLGLYVAKTIVEELGGCISVVSTVGKGTTFTIELPLAGTRKIDGQA